MKKKLSEIILEKGDLLKFPDLPIGAKKGLIHYNFLENGKVKKEVEDKLTKLGGCYSEKEINWDLIISCFDMFYADDTYHVYDMPTNDLTNFLMSQDCDFAQDHEGFEEYHQWYLSDDVPSYPESNRWHCLAYCDDEGIWDGWHRLHSYYRSGHKTIPLVY